MPKKNKFKPNKKKYSDIKEEKNNNNIIESSNDFTTLENNFLNNCKNNNHLNCLNNINSLLDYVLTNNKNQKLLSRDNTIKKIIEHIEKKIYSIPFLTNYIQFKKFCFENYPEKSNIIFQDNLDNLFIEVEKSFNNLKKIYNDLQSSTNNDMYSSIKNESVEINEEEYEEEEINYTSESVLITEDDLKNKEVRYIYPHKKKGKYYSFENYMNTLFWLEYEDCYSLLKESINKIYNESKNSSELLKKYNSFEEFYNLTEYNYRDIYYYKECDVVSLEFTTNGLILTILFRGTGNSLNFKKRMKYGSLLIITDYYHSNYILCTVFENLYSKKIYDENKKIQAYTIDDIINLYNLPEEPYYSIKVKVINLNPDIFKFILEKRNENNLQIYESRAYFESYIYTLKYLQKKSENSFPFKDEIIYCNFKKMSPEYLMMKDELKYKKNEKIILSDDSYPKSLVEYLDSSQLEAVKTCLNNKISIIQGPPGTGKTLTGAIVTEILLKNINTPILIVCHTNHALDQFIEHIMKISKERNIGRIGGRSKNEEIQKFNLRGIFKMGNYKSINNIIRQNEIGFLHMICDKNKNLPDKFIKEVYYDIFDRVINDFFKKINDVNLHLIDEINLFKTWNGEIKFDNFINDYYVNRNQLNERELKQFFDRVFYNFNYVEEKKDINTFKKNKNTINIQQDKKNFDYNSSDDESEDYEYDFFEIENFYNKKKKKKNKNNEKEKNYYEYAHIPKIKEENDLNKLLEKNLWDYDIIQRKKITFYLRKIYEEKYLKKFTNSRNLQFITEYKELIDKKEENEYSGSNLKKYKIIGMTSTGCSKYNNILKDNIFEIVILEEAAEVLESQLINILTKNTKHLIMIGDHKQLRPKPYNYELATKYFFDVSLFERLINNNIPYCTLKYQRRMKTKFADFVRLIYGSENYSDLPASDKCKPNNSIRGMVHDMYFISHENPEEEAEEVTSRRNIYEAYYLVELCAYLLKQEYKPEQITILTFYIGQVLLIKSIIRNYNDITNNIKDLIKNVHVTTVDKYQGEENDIILLSLVRSNKNFKIGFLRIFNRVCVAFSRAIMGFYIIGNFNCLIQSEDQLNQNKKEKHIKKYSLNLWTKIINKANEKKIIGQNLFLLCKNHNKKTIIRNYADFQELAMDGGCDRPCDKKGHLLCGHICENKCHPSSHDSDFYKQFYKCFKLCTKKCELNGHQCKKKCYEECGDCLEIVNFKPKNCEHGEIKIKCYQSIDYKCEKPCNKKLKCGHTCNLKCYEDCSKAICSTLIEKKLLCGHKELHKCGIPVCKCICQQKCNTKLPCGHTCEGTCGQCLNKTLHIPCKIKCGKTLLCQHICEQTCSQDCICLKSCENMCNHAKCNKSCYEKCIKCKEKCSNSCIHRNICKKFCYEICDIGRCNEKCTKKLKKCQHKCIGLCGERCPTQCKKCDIDDDCFNNNFGDYRNDENAIFYMTQCGHTFEVNFLDSYIDNYDKNRQNEENENKKIIGMLKCPICNQILTYEPRYQNIIKEKKDIIEKCKETYAKNNICNQIDITKIKKNIIYTKKFIKENNLKKKCNITYNLCKYIQKKKNKINLITTFNLFSLIKTFLELEKFAFELEEKNENDKDKIDNLPIIDQKFLNNFNIIKEYFIELKQFNNYFFKNFTKKLKNLKLYYKKENSKIIIDLNELEKTNFNIEIEMQDEIIIDIYKAKEILKEINGTSWYQCPKGHVYAIGDCGNPWVNAKCPECNESIGGTLHQLNEGNVRLGININNNDSDDEINSDEIDESSESSDSEKNYDNNNVKNSNDNNDINNIENNNDDEDDFM